MSKTKKPQSSLGQWLNNKEQTPAPEQKKNKEAKQKKQKKVKK